MRLQDLEQRNDILTYFNRIPKASMLKKQTIAGGN